ncbi:1-(5-phosphoribosyl)-5-[(5-phosphoribosylamino)methylideneamino]imidazole-4-carboxamide isomerase [Candidatus Bathyarchaeota archaeon]|nr:1-(5-phosphoribosyl)-5-[(5-phosphoribosylamino)methylideneamino]imidazole-4-carboxamide isomerase [Candidatus Bathyarchaeota archaeon]
MIVIPSIDLLRGKCVRLFQGDPSQVREYYQDPEEAVELFQSQGASMLHIVDLDAALGLGDNLNVISRIIKSVKIGTQVGGGIRSMEKAKKLLNLGVSRIVFGTACIRMPELVYEASSIFGKDRVAAAIDVRNGSPTIEGWKSKLSLEYVEVAKRLENLGVGTIIFTSVNADGTLRGPALIDVKRLVRSLSIPVIASGGIRDLDDIRELAKIGVQGVIVGTALYEKRFTLAEAMRIARNVS